MRRSALTSNFSAENRRGGAVVKLTTRSGGNQIYGTLFEFLRNDFFDARNFFDFSTEPYKQSQYGGTIGGPVKKNKLFYFGSIQGTNKRGSPSPKDPTVPTAAQHQGNFLATGHTIVDPTTGAPFPNDVIPQARWDSIGTKLLADIPLPNSGTNLAILPTQSNQDDYQLNSSTKKRLPPVVTRSKITAGYRRNQTTASVLISFLTGLQDGFKTQPIRRFLL